MCREACVAFFKQRDGNREAERLAFLDLSLRMVFLRKIVRPCKE
jgi:hypothetical protein